MPVDKKSTKPAKVSKGFSDFERSAMKERALELTSDKSDGESALLAKISVMKGENKAMAEKIHAIVKSVAPALSSKTWYGMPAYANKEGKVVCFFQNAEKFKARYSTLGFSDTASLDEGEMWATSFALKKMTPAVEAKITELVIKAAS